MVNTNNVTNQLRTEAHITYVDMGVITTADQCHNYTSYIFHSIILSFILGYITTCLRTHDATP